MTTNTTKIAEAISLLSTVLSSEVAQINHPFDNEEETDSLEDYDDLKELAEDYANELNNDLEIARGEISNCLEWESADPLDQDFDEKMWDDDEDETSEEETKEERKRLKLDRRRRKHSDYAQDPIGWCDSELLD